MLYPTVIPTCEGHICWFCDSSLCTTFGHFPCVHPSDMYTGQAVKNASTSYDAIVDFLELIEHFTNPLHIHSRVPSTEVMTEILVKIMVELISTLALVTKQIKQKRPSKCALTDMPLV
jgi:hypothetical protein